MSLKRALYWTLRRQRGNNTFVPMAVTLVKGSRVFGRLNDTEQTHTTLSECFGKFETMAQAVDKRDVIEEIKSDFARQRKPHTDAFVMLRMQEDAAIKRALSNEH